MSTTIGKDIYATKIDNANISNKMRCFRNQPVYLSHAYILKILCLFRPKFIVETEFYIVQMKNLDIFTYTDT